MAKDEIETFLDEVGAGLDRLVSAFISADSFDSVSTEAENLWNVLDEGEDVLDELDLSDLPDIIELSELPDVVEVEDTDDAIDEGDAGEVIDVRSLISAIKFRELWSSTDVRSLWEESDEFTDALEEIGIGDDDPDDPDDGMMEMDDDLENEMQSELYESKLQSQLQESADEFRAGTHRDPERSEGGQEGKPIEGRARSTVVDEPVGVLHDVRVGVHRGQRRALFHRSEERLALVERGVETNLRPSIRGGGR